MKIRKKSLTALLMAFILTIAAASGCSSAKPEADTGAAETETILSEDGTFAPTMFTVEGGTGKVTITCPEVLVRDGSAQARIEFSSPHYEWVKVDGLQYDPLNADDEKRENSVFMIPVRLDEKMTVSGLTTAMSEPHKIEYTLFISLTGKEEEGAASAQGGVNDIPEDEEDSAAAGAGTPQGGEVSEPPALEGLDYVSAMDTAYAETFDIYTYRNPDADGIYSLIDVHGSGQYLLLPQSSCGNDAAQEKIVKNLPSTVTVLQAPLDNLYVAATSSMALFDAAGAIGQVKLTGTKADGWYIDAPKKALESGNMVYAGKYSAPDYEMLASSGCDLAVESMMILHSPEVKEKLEELGIPVFIDTSSNESHPLGRTEWVRLYGVLTGHEEEADTFFEEQKQQFAEADSYRDTGKTIAFFSISTNGNVIVRATDDYIPRMIDLAGGEYIFTDLLNQSEKSASVRLSMEDFYNTAKDADFLIYNATIESPVANMKELCGKSSLLSDFKAVQEGNVWQVQRSLYQSPDIAAQMIKDIHCMLTGEDTSAMTFLQQVGK